SAPPTSTSSRTSTCSGRRDEREKGGEGERCYSATHSRGVIPTKSEIAEGKRGPRSRPAPLQQAGAPLGSRLRGKGGEGQADRLMPNPTAHYSRTRLL